MPPAIQPLVILSRTADFHREETIEFFQEVRAPDGFQTPGLTLGVAAQH